MVDIINGTTKIMRFLKMRYTMPEIYEREKNFILRNFVLDEFRGTHLVKHPVINPTVCQKKIYYIFKNVQLCVDNVYV